MADDQTQTTDPSDQQAALVQQLLRQTLTGQAAQPQEPPHSGDNRTWGSLLGQALVGGAGPGSTDAANERAGLQALSSIGLGMMSGSDYSQQRHSLGSIVAGAIGGAQESNAAQNAAQLDYQTKQQELQLGRLREAIPLLTMLQTMQQQKALRGLTPPALGATAPGANVNIGAVGGNTYEAAIGGHEGLGADPRLPSTVGGFRPDTWQGFVTANPDLFKGMTPEQAAAARSDPTLNARGISWLAQQNADTLTKAGVTPSGPALGVAHYIGAGAAAKALQAPDNAPVRDFVSADAVKYNPELGTMTVGQLKQRYAGVPAPAFLGGPKPGTAPAPAVTAQTPPAASTAAPGVAQGDAAHPELAPGPPGSTGGAPIGIGAALAPPVVAGTPLPAGKLQSTGKPPGQAAADIIQSGVQLAQATPLVRGTGQEAGPSSAVATLAAPATSQPSWGTGAAAGYNVGTTGAASPAPQPASQAQQPPQAPPVVTTGAIPRSTPDAVPDTFEEYQRQHPIVPSEEDRRSFSTAPDADQLALLQRQAQLAKYAMDVARSQGDAAGVAKASEAYNTILASENTVRENAAKAGADRRAAFLKDQGANQFAAWKDAQAEKQKRITQQQQADQQFRLKEEEGRQTRLTAKDAVFNQANQKGLETAQTEQANARDIVTQAEGFRALSDNVGQPGWLQTTKFPGDERTIAERLQQSGIKLDDTAGVQLLRGGITNLVKTLRAGMPMGSLSDRDLSFVERMGPTEWMDQDTRTAAVSYIVQAYRAKMRFASDVQKEMSRGKNYGDAVDAADAKQKPFVPAVPADLTAHWRDPDPAWMQRRIQWAQENDVRPGTLYHMSDGSIAVMRDPNRKLKTEQR